MKGAPRKPVVGNYGALAKFPVTVDSVDEWLSALDLVLSNPSPNTPEAFSSHTHISLMCLGACTSTCILHNRCPSIHVYMYGRARLLSGNHCPLPHFRFATAHPRLSQAVYKPRFEGVSVFELIAMSGEELERRVPAPGPRRRMVRFHSTPWATTNRITRLASAPDCR